MIRTGEDLAAARLEMRLSLYAMADLLRLGGTSEKGAQRIRSIEQGRIPVSGPLAVATEALLSGWRPTP